MPKITFLSAHSGPRISKTFSPGKQGIFVPTNLDSASYDLSVDDMDGKLELYKSQAKDGAIVFKGHFANALQNESRAGKTIKMQTQTLILDIDGIVIPGLPVPDTITQSYLLECSEAIVAALPEEFADVSYIVNASSSMGMKGDKVSMHIHFWLSVPMDVGHLNTYLRWLNFHATDLIKDNLCLTDSRNELHWVIDQTLSQNSRFVITAAPTFNGVKDPFESFDNRWGLMKKGQNTLNLSQRGPAQVTKNATDKAKTRLVTQLRAELGLDTVAAQTSNVKESGGYTTRIRTNPDRVENCEMVHEHADYVTYNLNGGDSAAYFVRKNSPTIMRNWKGELPFSFETVNEEAYTNFLEKYPHTDEVTGKQQSLVPFIFHDIPGNTDYCMMRDALSNEYSDLHPMGTQAQAHFMRDRGAPMPDPIPQIMCEYNPLSDKQLNIPERTLNLFQLPPLMDPKLVAPIPTEFQNALAEEAHAILEQLCPNINKLIWSIIGFDEECYARYINWQAFSMQKRRKSTTAWIWQGTVGTGKGQFISRVLSKIYGQYHHDLMMRNFKDKFNDFTETSLLVIIDEFKISGRDHSDNNEQIAILKNAISDESTNVRGMHKANRAAKSYMSLIMPTNQHDSMQIEHKDRRINVGTWQYKSLNEQYGEDLDGEIFDHVDEEVASFASFMMQLDVSVKNAMNCLENQAKRELQIAAGTPHDSFIQALDEGNLPFFSEVTEDGIILDQDVDDNQLRQARIAFTTMVNVNTKAERDGMYPVSIEELQKLAIIIIGKGMEKRNSFLGILRHAKVMKFDNKGRPERVYFNPQGTPDRRKQGIMVRWEAKDVAHYQKKHSVQAELDHDKERMKTAPIFSPTLHKTVGPMEENLKALDKENDE